MELFDAHAHLTSEAFAEDLEAVLLRAEAAGVMGIISVIESLDEVEANLALARRYSLIKPALGLFPTILDEEAAEAMLAAIDAHADELVAIGEVGLDYWKVQDEDGRKLQRRILARFVDKSNVSAGKAA